MGQGKHEQLGVQVDAERVEELFSEPCVTADRGSVGLGADRLGVGATLYAPQPGTPGAGAWAAGHVQ